MTKTIESRKEIPKHYNHDHFWIEDGYLYESYQTIRGLRYQQIKYVPGMPDMGKCDNECINYLFKEYFEL